MRDQEEPVGTIPAEEGNYLPDDPADLGDHVRNVLEAAESAANRIVDDARAEGERRIGEAKQSAQRVVDERRERMRELSDELLRQADAIESRLGELDAVLEAAIEGLRRELERLPDREPDDPRTGARSARD